MPSEDVGSGRVRRPERRLVVHLKAHVLEHREVVGLGVRTRPRRARRVGRSGGAAGAEGLAQLVPQPHDLAGELAVAASFVAASSMARCREEY